MIEVIGQFWYVAPGTLGLGLIGVISLARHVTQTSPNAEAGARRLTIVFLLSSAVSVLLISSYFFFRAKSGPESFIVGRHNDSFVPIWTAVGVAFLLGAHIRRKGYTRHWWQRASSSYWQRCW
ncbi:MAG: hypothetical protein M3337_05690 [Actinomycetota bacterium]|nr:hypothetical protein [Actinomycetota bacterium]